MYVNTSFMHSFMFVRACVGVYICDERKHIRVRVISFRTLGLARLIDLVLLQCPA